MPPDLDDRPYEPTAYPVCSFCGKPERIVERLIAGPGIYICDESLPCAWRFSTLSAVRAQSQATSDTKPKRASSDPSVAPAPRREEQPELGSRSALSFMMRQWTMERIFRLPLTQAS